MTESAIESGTRVWWVEREPCDKDVGGGWDVGEELGRQELAKHFCVQAVVGAVRRRATETRMGAQEHPDTVLAFACYR